MTTSERMLPETGELTFKALDELVEFTKKLQEADIWKRFETSTLKVEPIADNPLSLFLDGADNEKERLQLQAFDDDVVLECMENEGCVVTIPGENIPVRYTAIRGIRDRAGINGPVFARLNRYENADILNMALKYWGNQCLVLVRDQKVTAVHSGDANDYSVLPQGDLFEAFEEGLGTMFGPANLEFSGGFVSHELSGCDIKIVNTTASAAFAAALTSIGEPTTGTKLMIQLRVSDIATNGANLYPMLLSGDKQIQVGDAIRLTHKHKHSIDDFKINVGQIMALYRDGADKMNELASISVKNPIGCIRNVAKKLGIPKKYVIGTCGEWGVSDLISMHGMDESSAFEVYYYLFKIMEIMTSKGASNKELFNMQETISRALYVEWADMDCECDW